MTFEPGYGAPVEDTDLMVWFVFDGNRLLVRIDGDDAAPLDSTDMAACGLAPDPSVFIGWLDRLPVYVAGSDDTPTLPEGYEWQDLRVLMRSWPRDLAATAGYASHLWVWDHTHQYCGRCGHPMEDKSDERAKQCPRCRSVNYPRVSPAVIVAVVDGDRILLARNHRFRAPFYSVLAGFVEPGETLEECVRREVHEEVGLDVDRIRYFGSQPWPFPDSVMVGFTARHAGGTIQPDDVEISEADWFEADAMPRVPPTFSIAGQLIEWFVNGGRP